MRVYMYNLSIGEVKIRGFLEFVGGKFQLKDKGEQLQSKIFVINFGL